MSEQRHNSEDEHNMNIIIILFVSLNCILYHNISNFLAHFLKLSLLRYNLHIIKFALFSV